MNIEGIVTLKATLQIKLGHMHYLTIENFQLNLKIGVSAAERKNAQKIFLNVKISVDGAVPPAEISDNIKDVSVNYDKLLQKIRQLERNEYKLIEHCAAEIYTIVHANVKEDACIIDVEVHKYPEIDNLIGGVKYKISR